MPKKPETPATKEFDIAAMAEDLSPRGVPYRYGRKEFPPGEWVEISEREAERLKFKSNLKIKRKGHG